jgi:hypothetical protein
VNGFLSFDAQLGYHKTTKSSLVPSLLAHFFDETSAANADDWTEGGIVSVRVERIFPVTFNENKSLSPAHAVKDAWLEYHWKKGGGLPIVVTELNAGKIKEEKKRMILPIMMEESITEEEVTDKNNSIDSCQLQYQVTKAGPFLQADLIPNSHLSTVKFVTTTRTNEGQQQCQMIWDIVFEVKRLRRFYEIFTEFNVATAAMTVSESVATPRLLTLRTTLYLSNASIYEDIVLEARNQWLQFFWKDGGGLPVPPAISFGDRIVHYDDKGIVARRNLLRVPPLLIESIVDMSTSNEYSEAVYEISNPGWMSFPFLVLTHLGRVRFLKSREDCTVDVVWEVEIRPYRLFGPIVEKLVEMTVSTILRNMQVHMAQPGATVAIKAPRGKQINDNFDSFGLVPIDTWLGGVLNAHLSDKRSAWEQTLSLFQPWTWGRSGNGSNDDIVQFQWSNGPIH